VWSKKGGKLVGISKREVGDVAKPGYKREGHKGFLPKKWEKKNTKR